MAKRHLTRRQHIVTSKLLDKFADTDGALWAYERNKPVRKSAAPNECHERDFYEYELDGRATQNKYEDWLGRIEGDAIPLIDLLISGHPMADEQRVVFALFVGSQFARTRKVRAQISTVTIDKFRKLTSDPQFARDLQYELFKQGYLPTAQEVQAIVDNRRIGMERSPSFHHIIGLPDRTRLLAESLLTKRWFTVEAPRGMSFVTSDCPVSTVDFIDGKALPGVGFAKKTAAIFLPLTARHVFVASEVGGGPVASPHFVRDVNRLTVQFAHRNVYATTADAGIAALVDDEINSIVFGENAFLIAS